MSKWFKKWKQRRRDRAVQILTEKLNASQAREKEMQVTLSRAKNDLERARQDIRELSMKFERIAWERLEFLGLIRDAA